MDGTAHSVDGRLVLRSKAEAGDDQTERRRKRLITNGEKTGETRDGGTTARGTSNDERTGELRDVVGRERWWCVTDGGKGTRKQ